MTRPRQREGEGAQAVNKRGLPSRFVFSLMYPDVSQCIADAIAGTKRLVMARLWPRTLSGLETLRPDRLEYILRYLRIFEAGDGRTRNLVSSRCEGGSGARMTFGPLPPPPRRIPLIFHPSSCPAMPHSAPFRSVPSPAKAALALPSSLAR